MELEAVAKLDDGNRLIMLLDVANLMRDRKLREIDTGSSASVSADTKVAAEKAGDLAQELTEVQLVTFMLSGEEYGVPISQIQEIDRLSKVTKVPKAARFIEGVTNLRGEVIPVLDTRKRFDLEAKVADDRTRIMIVELGGVKTGLIVDSVREVLSLPKEGHRASTGCDPFRYRPTVHLRDRKSGLRETDGGSPRCREDPLEEPSR